MYSFSNVALGKHWKWMPMQYFTLWGGAILGKGLADGIQR